MSDRLEPLIWWTSSADMDELRRGKRRYRLPRYLREQIGSRDGRAGRGRLWVDESFGDVAVDPWPETPFAKLLGEKFAGIIIHRQDLQDVMRMPGVVTDLNLQRVPNHNI